MKKRVICEFTDDELLILQDALDLYIEHQIDYPGNQWLQDAKFLLTQLERF